jgi:hypothetical protein
VAGTSSLDALTFSFEVCTPPVDLPALFLRLPTRLSEA